MNYPSGIKKQNSNNQINFSNRGMALENDLNLTNEYYRNIDKAYIYKKPTPVKITKVNYPSRDKAVITQAFFTVPSTTDYNGIYKGKYIDFEAKETKSKTSFSLNNIHKHQIDHLIKVKNHGGISFLVIRFTTINKTFLLETEKLEKFLYNNERKSIPLSYISDNGYLINENYNPRLEYIKIIDKLL